MDEIGVYHLKLFWSRCFGRAFLNGFPVVLIDASWSTFYAPPVNPFLVGSGNTLVIEASPPLRPPKNRTVPSDVSIIGSISRLRIGDIVGPEAQGEQVIAVNVQEDLRGTRAEFPVRATYTFDNTGATFRSLFLRDPENLHELELIDYGLYLRDLAHRASVPLLVAEFETKIYDYAVAYGQDPDMMRSGFAEFLARLTGPLRLDLEFDRIDIRVRSYADGRVLEIGRCNDEPLFKTHSDGNGGTHSLRVFVSKLRGRLLVVR